MTIVYYYCVGLWLKQLPPKTSPPWTLAPLLQCPPKENVWLKTGLLEMMWAFSPHRTDQGWGRLKKKSGEGPHQQFCPHLKREKSHINTDLHRAQDSFPWATETKCMEHIQNQSCMAFTSSRNTYRWGPMNTTAIVEGWINNFGGNHRKSVR